MRYFIKLSYHGGNYHGWQVQPDVVTVQEKLVHSLSVILREKIEIVGAGRTDAGVHAEQLFAHFDVEFKFDSFVIQQKINAFLPDDIVVNAIFLVKDDLHSRFDAISRSYEYRIWLGRNPFLLDSTWQIHQKILDVTKMNEAAEVLLNYTNFKCFSKSKTDVRTYNCDITEVKWMLDGNRLTFYITADRFLRNMVRAIVGTLIEVGLGKKTKNDVIDIIESEDRSKAGVSVPAKGLFLTKVAYKEEFV
ncbi:MAG TPA: tRNA pseudouridine(38-40) synthase TruA [Flavobacteriaceae bacterium]|nr:tRNA pseudouridine(38-40) synthase TruA [Flavobacteriaceae bacterium]HBS12724.1 tRNA pseudouridine(38-40) synthase TruA [Flavobacteriaceae bacterium]